MVMPFLGEDTPFKKRKVGKTLGTGKDSLGFSGTGKMPPLVTGLAGRWAGWDFPFPFCGVLWLGKQGREAAGADSPPEAGGYASGSASSRFRMAQEGLPRTSRWHWFT